MQTHPTITFIPDSTEAFRRRGFDHGRELAEALAAQSHLPCAQLFNRPQSLDQRTLSRKSRIANMQARITIKKDAAIPDNILIVDDVFTTGSTILRAVSTLKEAGAQHVHALTFARAF